MSSLKLNIKSPVGIVTKISGNIRVRSKQAKLSRGRTLGLLKVKTSYNIFLFVILLFLSEYGVFDGNNLGIIKKPLKLTYSQILTTSDISQNHAINIYTILHTEYFTCVLKHRDTRNCHTTSNSNLNNPKYYIASPTLTVVQVFN